MNIKTTLKTSVAAAALFAVAAPVATPASAADDTLSSGNKNNLKISGYVAKALVYADDGKDDALFISDGSTSRTRVRWIASGTLNENVTAGAMIEMDIPLSNRNNDYNLGGAGANAAPTETNETTWVIRHQFVWVNHKKFGKLSLGNTNAAGNGGAEATLSGTNMVDLSSAKPFGSGIFFVDETTAGSLSRPAGITIGGAFTNIDGRSRTDVLRYDTPNFKGLSVAVSYINGGDWSLGANFSSKFGPFRLVAKMTYDDSQATNSSVESQLAGSMAVLHDSGINAAIAGGVKELDDAFVDPNNAGLRNDPTFWYFNVGYRAKIFSVGGTNISFSWNRTKNTLAIPTQTTAQSTADSIGFSIAQLFDPIGANVVLSYRNYSLDAAEDQRTFSDVDVVSLQSIFNF